MSNLLTVNLYAENVHVEVHVEAQRRGHYALALSVNGIEVIPSTDGFPTPHEALDYALTNYTGYPLTGVHIEGGKGALAADVATDFVRSVEGRGLRAFRKFLGDLDAHYGMAPAIEAEYRKVHAIWVTKGGLFDAAIALNKLRNSPAA